MFDEETDGTAARSACDHPAHFIKSQSTPNVDEDMSSTPEGRGHGTKYDPKFGKE